jgi:hypothetical protein
MAYVIVVRLFAALIIFRLPLLGGILSVILDFGDLNFLEKYDPSSLVNYQLYDKMLDFFYLSLEMYVAFRWKNLLLKRALIALYIYRLIGTVLFEMTNDPFILVIFPNVFEWFFLVVLCLGKLRVKDSLYSKKVVLTLVIVLFIPKVFHEYLLHVNKIHPWSENAYVKEITNPQLPKTFAK